MGKKLYIGNLPYSATDDFLKETFEQFGAVESARIITDRHTGRSKGFGFVEMASDEDGAKAIDQLNGADCEGRKINVSEARPMQPRSNDNRRGGGRGDFGGNRNRY